MDTKVKRNFKQCEIDELADEYLACVAKQAKVKDDLQRIKAELGEALESRGTDTISTRNHYVHLTTYSSLTLDSKKLKAEMPEIAERFQKVRESQKWNVK